MAKIVGGAIILIGSVLKWAGVFPNCSINELCMVGFSIMGIFGTVDINLMLEKVFGKKTELSNEDTGRADQ